MNLGDKVRWTSQSSGIVKEKLGLIVAVVKPNQIPPVTETAERYAARSLYGGGAVRRHESYLVLTNEGNSRYRIYWPRVSALEVI
jgi:hypothetical protein